MKASDLHKEWAPSTYKLVALCAAILFPTVITPFRFDNAVFQGIAFDLVRYGRVPFESSWLHDVPGLIYLHGLAILLFGDSDLSVRYLDIILQLSFVAFFFRFLQRWLTAKAAALSCVLYSLFYLGGGVYMYFQRDVFIAMLTVVAWHHLLRYFDTQRVWRFVLSGLVIGITILIRSTSVILLPVFAIYVWLTLINTRKGRRATVVAVLFTITCLVPLGALLLYYVETGLIKNFYLATVRWNTDLYSSSAEPLTTLAREFARVTLLWLIPIYFRFTSKTIGDVRKPLSSSEYIFWALLVISSLMSILIQHKFFRYHVAPLFIFTIPFTAAGILTLASGIRNVIKPQYALIAITLASTIMFFVPRSPLAFGLALTQNKSPLDATYEAEYLSSLDGALPEQEVLSYFQRPENRTGLLEVCSYDPRLRLHLRRECVGPYNVLDPIAWRLRTDAAGVPQYTDYQRDWQAAYMDLLRKTQPRWIVIDRNSEYYGLEDPYTSLLQYLPGFLEFFKSYSLDATFGRFEIYRRNERN